MLVRLCLDIPFCLDLPRSRKMLKNLEESIEMLKGLEHITYEKRF